MRIGFVAQEGGTWVRGKVSKKRKTGTPAEPSSIPTSSSTISDDLLHGLAELKSEFSSFMKEVRHELRELHSRHDELFDLISSQFPATPSSSSYQPAFRTIRELAAPDVHYQPLCIQYPQLDANFELKSGLIHLLPKFHGLAGEDPHKHLKEFHVVCSTMRPQGVDEEQIKLRAFPFSLDGSAKDWLYYLPPAAITSWDGLKRIFLEKFFPASRTASIRKEICGIRQMSGETLHEYWERFKKLCSSCPHHQISDQLLIQYLYEGLIPMDRYLVDAASGGALAEKTPAAAQELISKMAQNAQQFGTRINTPTKQNLETQIGQLATNINELRSQGSGQLPSQPVANPRGNVSAIMLRSGKEVIIPTPPPSSNMEQHVEKQNVEGSKEQQPSSVQEAKQPNSSYQEQGESSNIQPLPFPHRATQNKKRAEAEVDKEILETFQKVEVNIPLLEAIRQIPKYAKFLKDLCTHKRKLMGNEKINLGRNVSALIQPAMPAKCKDPGMFSIPCTIGDMQFSNALLDLGASINVMPNSIYASLQCGPLKPTGVVVQLANRSTAHPTGVLEDVLVKVKDLIFPADFYVLNMEDNSTLEHAPLILGRPFLKTARTIINVHEGTLSMEFAGNTINFKILDAMKFPAEDHSTFQVNRVDLLVNEAC
ncbi:uncharacterized protein LOC127787568, partial [Diospyros lotus]|uniref:uncharacterized protein LOC127787568 n=1 Tax=Diospyros lotus TaxID=55363 RepID=UPI00224D917F